MKQILIATHGKMASGIQSTAELIVGKMAQITTIDAYLTPDDNVEEKFDAYFKEHEQDRVIVFTDLMGGSVNQKLIPYSKRENVTLVTGTNLAVLLQVMMAEEDVSESQIRGYVKEARKELKVVSLEEISGGQPVGQPSEISLEKDSEEADSGKQTKAAKTQDPVKALQKKPEVQDYSDSKAKITALRVDDRLIHGQVAMTWTKQLHIKGIVVASDDAAADNTQKMALKMAAPAGIKVLVKPVDEAIRVLNDPRASKMRILVLTRTVKDALKIRRQVGEIGFLNIGNTGRFDGIDVSEKQHLSTTIMLTDSEVEALRQLVEIDPDTCMQQVPNDEQKLVKDVLSKLK